jgi:dephospho-CoA kinase
MRPLLVGLTGGIGSGKSLVARIFSCLNVPVYDADSRAKMLMNSDSVLVASIQKEFGNEAYDQNGVLNRKYLAATVFNNPEKLKTLNQLVHPRVQADTEKWVLENSGCTYLIKEAALLFESGSFQNLDNIIVVTAPQNVRVSRVMQRDGRSQQEVESIIRNQMAGEEKAARADFIIRNDESELVIPQVLKLHERFNTRVNM